MKLRPYRPRLGGAHEAPGVHEVARYDGYLSAKEMVILIRDAARHPNIEVWSTGLPMTLFVVRNKSIRYHAVSPGWIRGTARGDARYCKLPILHRTVAALPGATVHQSVRILRYSRLAGRGILL